MNIKSLNKKGIRVAGISESFDFSFKKSILVGVVLRKDMFIDGMFNGLSTIKGSDSTEIIIEMIESTNRNDINCIFLDGLIISMFNIIDGETIYNKTKIPIISITFRNTYKMSNIIYKFNYEERIKIKAFERERITLKTNKSIFIRRWGIDYTSANRIINYFTIQGSIPEPIRLSKMVAKNMLNFARNIEKNRVSLT